MPARSGPARPPASFAAGAADMLPAVLPVAMNASRKGIGVSTASSAISVLRSSSDHNARFASAQMTPATRPN
jgi:hypothetical protein